MSWTVACFCGNVYTAPPERCDVCGCSIDGADSGDLATKPAAGRRLGARPRRRARPSLPPEQVSERTRRQAHAAIGIRPNGLVCRERAACETSPAGS